MNNFLIPTDLEVTLEKSIDNNGNKDGFERINLQE